MLLCSGYILKSWYTTALGGKCLVRGESLKDVRLPKGQKHMRIIFREGHYKILNLYSI